jgi:hypothetical protein
MTRPELDGSRTTSSTVVFVHPFTIGRDARELPAGTYRLHTQEEARVSAFHTAYVAVSIDLEVPEGPGRTAVRVVKPADFSAARARDLARSRETVSHLHRQT